MITGGPAASRHAPPQARRLLGAILALLSVVFLAVDLGNTTTAAASNYGYDSAAVARVGIHRIETAPTASHQFMGSLECSASRPAQDRLGPTTPLARSVATNSVDDLAGAVSRPAGVADDFVS